MKMSDTICVPKSEPGFLTNCRLCLNESKFQTVSVFDEKYKNDDLARKIMLLTNIVITPPLSSHSDADADPPSSICIKCKNKVDAFLAWKETAWSLQKQFKPTPAPDSSAHHHHYRHSRHQGAKSEKLPLRGHRSSNDSCIDEDYDSLLASPCSSGPDGGSSMEEEGPHHHLMMEPVVKIEEESVEYNSAPHGDYGGGEGDPDSTELVIDENRLRHEQSRIQHFLNRGGANSILRSLISAELPIIRPPCSSEGAVLTNRTNLPISPALPPFKLDDSSKHGTPAAAPAVAPYRRKQRNPTRTHEGEDQAQEEGSGCALRALPDEVLSQKLPVPSSSSSSSSSSGGGHPASVIMHPSSSSSSSPPQHPHHASPKKARKSMYPFNYLLEAIDFTSRQSSPENTSDLVLGATSVIATTSPAPTPPPSCDDEREMQSPPQQQDTPMEEEPTPEPEALYHEEEEDEEEEEEEGNKDPEALEKMRRDLQELQRQQQKQREQDQLIIQQHLRETIAGVASRTQDPGDHETNHHDYSSPRAHPPPVFSIKLNTNHIPSSLSNGYYQGPDLKSAAEISLKNLLASHQAPGPPAILKKARAPRTSHYGAASGNHNSSSPSYGNHGNMNATGALSLKMTSSLSGPDSPSPSPSPSPLCMSPSPSPLPLPLPSNTSEAESPRGSPKIRFTSSQSPYPNLQIGQILPKRHDLACSNCNTKVTTIWRRYPSGEMVCNACGLYYRLHCRPRPVSMRRDNIHPRKRRPKTSGGGGGGAGASGGKRHSSHMLSNVDSGDKESLSSGDESSSISLNSFISTAPFHAMAPFPGSPLHHYAHGALNLSPLQCEDNLPLNLAAQPTAELAR